MELYDSHCHLDFAPLAEDLDGVLTRARGVGVEAVVIAGVDPEGWARAASITSSRPRVLRAVGLHPRAIDRASIADVEAFVRGDREVVAIGEVGWDRGVEASREAQDRVVDEHIELARALSLPVMFHVVGGYGHALHRLERHGPLPHGGVIHAYGGPAEMLASFWRLGLRVGFGTGLLRAGARRALESARAAPDDALLIETDAPDQGVMGRGRGELADLHVIAQRLAELRETSLEQVAAVTTRNARTLFGR